MSVSIYNYSTGFILVSGCEELNDGDNTLILQLPNNYVVVNNPYLKVYTTSWNYTYDFTQSGNQFILNLEDIDTSAIYRVELYGSCEEDTQLISDFPTIRCYSVDKTKMNDLMNERFYQVATNNFFDFANFILAYIRYPFTLEKTTNESKIILGYKQTNVNAKICKNQLYEVTVFDSILNGETETSNDIKNSEIVFELPFIARKTIDSKYINTQIKVVYKTDILTNKTTVLFYSKFGI